MAGIDTLRSLTDEELGQLAGDALLTEEEIAEALERGRIEAKKFLESRGTPGFNPGVRYQ